MGVSPRTVAPMKIQPRSGVLIVRGCCPRTERFVPGQGLTSLADAPYFIILRADFSPRVVEAPAFRRVKHSLTRRGALALDFAVTQPRDTRPSLACRTCLESLREDRGNLSPICVVRAFCSSLSPRRTCHIHPLADTLGQRLVSLSPFDTIKYMQVSCFRKDVPNSPHNSLISIAHGKGLTVSSPGK